MNYICTLRLWLVRVKPYCMLTQRFYPQLGGNIISEQHTVNRLKHIHFMYRARPHGVLLAKLSLSLSQACLIFQTLMDPPSLWARRCGCSGVWFSTTPSLCRTPRAPQASSLCPSGPSSLSSFSPATLPTWPPLWFRRSSWTRWRDWATTR